MAPDKQSQMGEALNRAQAIIDRLPPNTPECVRPALMAAMANWFAQGKLSPCLSVETGGVFPEQVRVPPYLNGTLLLEWMYQQFVQREATAVYFSFESVEDTLNVLYLDATAFHTLSADVATNGTRRELGAWHIETHYPETK